MSLRLGFGGSEHGFAIDIGLPIPDGGTMFGRDPVIKAESLWTGETLGRANEFARRRGPSVQLRDANGEWQQAATSLLPFDSMMTHCNDPRDGLELLLMREQMRSGASTITSAPTAMRRPARRRSARARPFSPAMARTSQPPSRPFGRSAAPRNWTTPSRTRSRLVSRCLGA